MVPSDNFKFYIKSIEERCNLLEEYYSSNYDELELFLVKNPNINKLKSLVKNEEKIRGWIINDNIYVWPAFMYVHFEVIDYIEYNALEVQNLESSIPFIVIKEKDYLELDSYWEWGEQSNNIDTRLSFSGISIIFLQKEDLIIAKSHKVIKRYLDYYK